MDSELRRDVVSGRRRATAGSTRVVPRAGRFVPRAGRFVPRAGRFVPRAGRARPAAARLVALVVALAGAVVLVVGGLQATVYAPSSTVRAALGGSDQPVITSAIGLLGLDGPRVRIEATDSQRRTVFAGIGRAADVDAYLAEVARVQVTGHDGAGGLLTQQVGDQATLPNPAEVDVWVTSVRSPNGVELTWPDAPGQWQLVVATDGTATAPDRVELTWTGRELQTIAPVLIAIGLVLLVIGLVSTAMLASRAGLERS